MTTPQRKSLVVADILEKDLEIGNLWAGPHGINLFAFEIREDPDWYEKHMNDTLDRVIEDHTKKQNGISLYPWKST